MLGRTQFVERSNDSLPAHLAEATAKRAGRHGLADRRRIRRRRGIILYIILLLMLFVAAIYGLQQSSVRISDVSVNGEDTSSSDWYAVLSEYAINAMKGSYLGIIPRDSIFFFPEENIRANILTDYPDIAAVSIYRSGFNSLSIKTDYRVPIARWCGTSPTVGTEEHCYVFDSGGLIYKSIATTTQTVSSFAIYAPLVDNESEPFLATILHAEKLPSIFDFARQLTTFGPSVIKIVIHDDEVDDYLDNNTRVTYLLGDEKNAFTALVSARDKFNLSDDSVDYIDLRFDGKVYLKKK